MKIIGAGLILIGIGIIGYDLVLLFGKADISKKIPKGKTSGQFDLEPDEW